MKNLEDLEKKINSGLTTKIDKTVIDILGITNNRKHTQIDYLESAIKTYKSPKHEVTIAICGKYNSLHDAYKSILEAFIHSGIFNDAKINIKWVDTELLEKNMDYSMVMIGHIIKIQTEMVHLVAQQIQTLYLLNLQRKR